MSNDKLAKALREAADSLRTLELGAMREEYLDDAYSVRAYARSRADLAENALQAHAAEAAHPQPGEPVAYILKHEHISFKPTIYYGEVETLQRKFGGEILNLYTHPQPADQDAKDAARYRHMIETSPFMCFGASGYHKKSDLDEAIDDSIAAMMKESGR